MKRIWFAIAVIGLMAGLSIVGCSADAGNAPAQNPQPGAPQQPGQNPGGGQPGPFGGPGVSGTVKNVSGSTIQLSAQDGSTVTVKTDSNTMFQKTVTGTLADIQVGARITVVGEQSSGTTTARTIQVMSAGGNPPGTPPAGSGQPAPGGTPPAPGGAPPSQGGGQPGGMPGLGGTVKSVSGNTIQLTGFDGSTTTVKVDDKTTIQKTASATLADIQANTQITVVGDSSGGTIAARMIRLGTDGK